MFKKDILTEVRKLIHNSNYKANENFFKSGGTSIQIIELAKIVYQITNKELDMEKFFLKPYIDQIEFIDNKKINLSDNSQKPKALFIHDGSGTTNSYRFFFESLKNTCDIVTIDFPEKEITAYPQLIDVKKLALQYFEKLDADCEFEYLFGWCIGGKIAYELSKYIKKVDKIIIMNSPAPNSEKKPVITFKSETDFIRKKLKMPFFKTQKNSVEFLWEDVIEYYFVHSKRFEFIKRATPLYIKYLIPGFYSNALNPNRYFKYLTLIRSFSFAHELYSTEGVISDSRFYFFNAIDENFDKEHRWEDFVDNGSSYELPGGHTDIVNKKNSIDILKIIG